MTVVSDLFEVEFFFINKFIRTKKILRNLKYGIKNISNMEFLLSRYMNLLQGEFFSLQKEGLYIADIIKRIKKNTFLIKTSTDGKLVINFSNNVTKAICLENSRIILRNHNHSVYKILHSVKNSLSYLIHVEKNKTVISTYKEIGGLDFQIEQLKEVVELPIKFPEIFEILGVCQPKGVLMYGPPGTGKTLLARAVAYHSNCTFIKVSSSELVQKYIGEGSKMIRNIFKMAKAYSPSIIFIDEIDSIGSSRIFNDSTGGDLEVQRTMLELLNQLDGFESEKKVKILMATNRIDVLDSALIRPGRIDRRIKIPSPNTEGRLVIFKIHFKNIKVESGIDIWKLSKILQGSTGADIKSICTEAGIFAIRNNRNIIIQEDLTKAILKMKKKKFIQESALRNFFKSKQK
nr:26S proteasome SU [Cryptomonas paramecium]